MSTALSPLAGIARMAGAATSYVASIPAPEPASITLYPHEQSLDLQPAVDSGCPADTIATLLLWSHRLTGITGHWVTTRFNTVLIRLFGRGPHGVAFKLYTTVDAAAVADVITLPEYPGTSTTPDELYHLVCELRANPEGVRS